MFPNRLWSTEPMYLQAEYLEMFPIEDALETIASKHTRNSSFVLLLHDLCVCFLGIAATFFAKGRWVHYFCVCQLSMGLQWPLTLSKLRSASNPWARNSSPTRRQKTQTATMCVLRNAACAKCAARAHIPFAGAGPLARNKEMRSLARWTHLSLFSMWYLFLRESAWCLGSRGDPIPKSAKNAQKCGAVWFIAIIMWRKRRKGREGGERAASARVIIIIISCSSDLQPPSSLLPGTSRNITKTNRQTWPRKRRTVASWAPLFPHKTMRIKLLSSQFLRLSRKKAKYLELMAWMR